MTDDQLDAVYREFFRRELPAELPPFAKSEVKRTAGESRSRYVLAASVAALLGLGLWLSSTVEPAKGSAKGSASKFLKDAEADGKNLLDNIEMP